MSRRHQPRTDVTDDLRHHQPPGVIVIPTLDVPADADDWACPGMCNATARRHEAAQDGTDNPHTWHIGRPVWCRDVPAFNDRGELLPTLAHHGCTEAILDRLARLPDLATHLTPGRLNAGRDGDVDPGAGHGGGARAMAHAPSPSPGWDTADEVVRWLVDLEDWLRERLHDDPAPVKVVGWRRERRTLSAAVTYLTAHGDALLSGPDAATIGHDVFRTANTLQRLTGRDRLVHRLVEPCPHCGRKGLRRVDGSELVSCTACHATWDWEHLEMLCRLYAEDVKASGGVGA